MSLTAKRLHKLLHYNPKTGVFTWRVITRKNSYAGAVAGNIKEQGYRRIIVDYKEYRASRLACLYMTESWPEAEMDHRNCNPSDDRWRNIRPATVTQNRRNKSAYPNKSLPKGVSLDKRRRNKKYKAYIGINKRYIHLGNYDDPNDAHAAYIKAAENYFGRFARAR